MVEVNLTYVPRCPKCGSTKLSIAIHTCYRMEDGVVGRVVTDGPDENLDSSSHTMCCGCKFEAAFERFTGKEKQ